MIATTEIPSTACCRRSCTSLRRFKDVNSSRFCPWMASSTRVRSRSLACPIRAERPSSRSRIALQVRIPGPKRRSMKSRIGCRPGIFAQLAETVADQVVVGSGSREPIRRVRAVALHPGRQVRKPAQQGMLPRLVLLLGKLLIDPCKLAFHRRDFGADLSRDRQPQQRHQAIGLHLEHALHQPSSLKRRQIPRLKHDAAEVIGVQPEAAVEVRRPLPDETAPKGPLLEVLLESPGIGRPISPAERQMQSRRDPTGYRPEPVARDVRQRSGLPQRVTHDPVDKRISRELRMPFPAKLEPMKGLIEAGSVLRRRAHLKLSAELRQMRMLFPALPRRHLNRNVTDAARRLDQRRRPAVKLLIELGTRGMNVEQAMAGHGGES